MAQQDDKLRSRQARVARLRVRLNGMRAPLTVDDANELIGVLKGVLDLLEDG